MVFKRELDINETRECKFKRGEGVIILLSKEMYIKNIKFVSIF